MARGLGASAITRGRAAARYGKYPYRCLLFPTPSLPPPTPSSPPPHPPLPQMLMGAPNIDDPLAADIAEEWRKDQKKALATARDWTAKYAK